MVKDYVVQTFNGFIMHKPRPSIRRREGWGRVNGCLLGKQGLPGKCWLFLVKSWLLAC